MPERTYSSVNSALWLRGWSADFSLLMNSKTQFLCLCLTGLLWIAGAAWILRDELRADCLSISRLDKPITDLELTCGVLATLPSGHALERGLRTVRANAAGWIILPPLGLLHLGCTIEKGKALFRRADSTCADDWAAQVMPLAALAPL